MKCFDSNAEILEAIWTFEEKGRCSIDSLKIGSNGDYVVSDEVISLIERTGLITVSNGEIHLTEKGKSETGPIIRRHRLAERLLTDILGMTPEETEESACEYEHVLAPGLTEAICTLLGHPRECPHGSPIPEGECCRRADVSIQSAVKSIDQMNVGDTVRVSYIKTDDHLIINKLYSHGISSGQTLKIRQKFPSFVLQIDHSQVALEKSVAENIYGLRT